MRKGLTFDDVCLVPRYSNIDSRVDPTMDLSSWLTRKIKVGMPLVPSNMDTVIGSDLAKVIVGNGGVPIFHRFTDFETQKKWVEEFEGKVVLSCGISKFDEVSRLADLGPAALCVDVAHGHSNRMVNLVGDIKKHYPGTLDENGILTITGALEGGRIAVASRYVDGVCTCCDGDASKCAPRHAENRSCD